MNRGRINAINTLITQDKVVGILGPCLCPSKLLPLVRSPIQAKVPILGPSNTAKGIPQIGEYVGRVSAPVAVVAPNAVKTALKINPKIKKVAVFLPKMMLLVNRKRKLFKKP
jgi:branched-chain amino acid transport system substrate-binding protein